MGAMEAANSAKARTAAAKRAIEDSTADLKLGAIRHPLSMLPESQKIFCVVCGGTKCFLAAPGK